MLVILIIGIIYFAVMAFFLYGSLRIPVFATDKTNTTTEFSIVIPFRNEAENLPKLLDSIKRLNYPSHLYEVIFIDDASTDNSIALISQTLKGHDIYFDIIQNNRFSASPKKDAITTAVKLASFEWILTTDADCVLPVNWLYAYHTIITHRNPQLIAGPICFESNGSLLEEFQQMDGFSLQIATMGGFGLKNPFLCNGANLAYKKEAFNALDGFVDNNHIASGDDIFIMGKIERNYPEKIEYLKSRDAIVVTRSVQSWKAVLKQRIRWASKTTKQKSLGTKALGFLIFFTNVLLFIGFALIFFKIEHASLYISFLVLKIGIDFVVLWTAAKFFQKPLNFLMFMASSVLYPLVSTLVVLGSLFGQYEWKGREYRKNP
tara:strand:+ start:19762 stop:20889 length:1128 start_codon:yes stop_codon:yes gene_type:complete